MYQNGIVALELQWVPWILVVVLALACWFLSRRSVRTRRILEELRFDRRSEAVRGGHLAESLAPLVDGFPVDVRKPGSFTAFLGQPVDYVHFDPEEGIVFVEIKSGGSTLSARERQVRDAVAEGRVEWREVRIE